MIPRLDISFPLSRQWQYWFGHEYMPAEGEYMLNHARSGIYMTLRAVLPDGGRVGVMAYNCDTVMNAVTQAGCKIVFLDVNEDLTLDITQLANRNLDAIVVSNLFGIKNDIAAVREACPHAFIIEDNAHGYGLAEDGNVVVCSINQGKYPALGPGGIMRVRDADLRRKIDEEYNLLPKIGIMGQIKIFILMLAKALMYHPWVYGWLTKPIKEKKGPKSGNPEPIQVTRMCPGVARMYDAWLSNHHNHLSPAGEGMRMRLFMDIIHTDNPEKIIAEYREKGIEAETHFRHWPVWASHYGYISGSCPMAEKLVNELVMVPNYYGTNTSTK